MAKKKKEPENWDCPKCEASTSGGFEIPRGERKCIDPECGWQGTWQEAEEYRDEHEFD